MFGKEIEFLSINFSFSFWQIMHINSLYRGYFCVRYFNFGKMKRMIFAFLFVGAAMHVLTMAQTPDFSMIGYATLNGGTTGGAAGQTVIPTTFEELKQYVESEYPYTILITKEFTTGVSTFVDETGSIVDATTAGARPTTFGAILKVKSNKTLLGVGSEAFFNRIGLVIQCQSNIIIRNIKFTMKDVPATRDGEYKILDTDGVTTVGDPDCIGIQADAESVPAAQRISQHIWVDHCEFYNEANAYHKDRYDGLLDIKNDVRNMTVSWCVFHDHSKAMLSGKGNSDEYNRTVTYHHNWFHNIYGSRLPLLRFGQHHYYNNLMENCDGDGLNLRIQTNAYIEDCYFLNCKKPLFGKLSEGGQALLVDNVFSGCGKLPAGCTNQDGAKFEYLKESEEFNRACNFTPSELYLYTPDETANVPNIVRQWAGVGKLQEETVDVIVPIQTETRIYNVGNLLTAETEGTAQLHLFAVNGQQVAVYSVDGGRIDLRIDLPGCYVATLRQDGKQLTSAKLLVP